MWKLGLATVLALQFGAAEAQQRRNMPLPAEFPPITYKGAQYVDSNGCVFIRAGSYADVTWIPRLTRQRQQICGQEPTRISAADLSAAEPSQVIKITLDGLKPVTVTPGTPQPVAGQNLPAPAPKASSFHWTETAPHRLIDRVTGRDVTSIVALVYPYTDFETQRAELGAVSIVRKDGRTFKRLVRNSPKPRAPRASEDPQPSAAQFVQVAAFASPQNAQRTAARLAAEGLPVQFGTMRQGGQDVQLVLSGPFPSKAAALQALQRVVQLGFGDAYIRKGSYSQMP